MRRLRTKPWVLAVLGMAGILFYFWLSSRSNLNALFRQDRSRGEIVALAEEAFQQSEFAEYKMSRRVNLDLDRTLLHYAQLRDLPREPGVFYPVAVWEVTWKGKTPTKKEGLQDVEFSLSYDFSGKLVGLTKASPNLNRPPNLEEEEALAEAKRFLRQKGVDVSLLRLSNKIINKDDRVLNYDFTFSKPSPIAPELKEVFDLHITGETVTDYRARVVFSSDAYLVPPAQKTAEVVSAIAMLAVWTGLAVLLLLLFFKRLRHDELEFKRARWLGLLVLVLTWIYIALQTRPEWESMVVGGGFAGFFCGLCFLLVYSATDSFARDVWHEKLALADVLSRGFLRVKELGRCLLDSLFFSGATLLLFGLFIWLTRSTHIGYLSFDSDALWALQGKIAVLSAVLKDALAALFIAFLLLLFGATYLRNRLRSEAAQVVILALLLDLAGLDLYHVRPTYLSFVLFLPIAGLWAYFILRYDLIAVLLALFTVKFFLDMPFIANAPTGLNSAVLLGVALVLGQFLGGWFLSRSKLAVKDFEDYVPEYVSRIAERERFLKELEIARTVQQRFLPQVVPSVPALDIACICRPAMEVGGDYYDFIQRDNRTLGIVIGDVSGKGVSAAFYMTMVKGIIKTLVKSTAAPKQMLTEMNTIFYENAPRNVFISVAYGLFDFQNRTLTFARAGHNPIIIHKSTLKRPEMLNSRGMAIGLERGDLFSTTIEEVCLPLERGDTFVFFTDGVSESANRRGEEFGEERLQSIISEHPDASAQSLLDEITREVSHFALGKRQHDDITMVVVRVKA
ncbi:MAG: hypothetical protein D6743_12305 [Calditrichaeota bacterium]|nr:MAG: hypothetical protein D6743_12305 [Calditrichota bacterium]